MGGRLDTIQAAVLNVKLKYYPKDLRKRAEVASKYTKALENKSNIVYKKNNVKNSNFILKFNSHIFYSLFRLFSTNWREK